MSDGFHNGWALEFHSGIPVYKQIINRVRAAMASGSLYAFITTPQDKVPQLEELRQLQQAR